MLQIFEGDHGTVFEITVKENGAPMDISSVQAVTLRLEHEVSLIEKPAALKNTGADGLVTARIERQDVLKPGIWTVQCKLAFLDGEWRTSRESFEVVK